MWAIGSQKKLGSCFAKLISTEDVSSPQKATTWKYFDGNKFITSVHILVNDVAKSGTLIIIS